MVVEPGGQETGSGGVKGKAEDEDVRYITERQSEMVWHKDVGGCASWVSLHHYYPYYHPTYCVRRVDHSTMMKKPAGMIYCSQIFKPNSTSEHYSPYGNISITR